MTTELEKQFFDTFGIEPNTTGYELKQVQENARGLIRVPVSEYPQITDSILLGLICINNKNTRCIHELIVPRNLKLLKKSTLRRLIENSKNTVQIKHQVQAIFEGER